MAAMLHFRGVDAYLLDVSESENWFSEHLEWTPVLT